MHLGKLYYDNGNYVKAAELFQTVLKQEPDQSTRIHLAKTYLAQGAVEQAESCLLQLDAETVLSDLKLEFLTVESSIALKKQDGLAVGRLVQDLRKLEIKEIYFRGQRDQLVIELLEFMNSSSPAQSLSAAKKSSGIIRNILKWSNYFELKPNIIGLGINFNKMIEDWANEKLKEKGTK